MYKSLFLRRLMFRVRKGRRMFAVLMLVCGIIFIVLSVLLSVTLTPTVVELALAAATDEITLAVNETVSEVMGDGSLDYSNLVTLERDGQGNITALVSNVATVNMLQARITNAVVEKFANSDITHVTIPLGNLIGGPVFSGRGPRIGVDILSITNVSTSFRNEFTSAGINQTRHRIIMDVLVTLEVMLGGNTGTDSVLTEINVAETVIVGNVPGAYAAIG